MRLKSQVSSVLDTVSSPQYLINIVRCVAAAAEAPKAESTPEPKVATAKPAADVEDVQEEGDGPKVLSKKEKEKLKKEREKVCRLS